MERLVRLVFFVAVTLLTLLAGAQGRLYPHGRPGDFTTLGPSNVTLAESTNMTRAKNEGIMFWVESTDVMTYMDEKTTVLLNYSVNCSILPLNDYAFVVSVTDNTVISIAKVKPSVTNDVVVGCTHKAGNGGNTLSGGISITLDGLLPGRSLLIIDVVSKNTTGLVNPPHVLVENSSSIEYHYLRTGSNDSFSYLPPYASSAANASDVTEDYFPAVLHAICMKEQTALDNVFRALMVLFLICLMVAMGCKTELQVLREVWSKPIAPVIGLACQFFLMPLVSPTF